MTMNDWDDGKSTWVTSALMMVMAVIVLLFCGCQGYYYVVPSDRELVPVAASNVIEGEGERRTYVETEGEDCTGWYVPNAVLTEWVEDLEAL